MIKFTPVSAENNGVDDSDDDDDVPHNAAARGRTSSALACLDYRSPAFHRVAAVAFVLVVLLVVNLVAISRLTHLVRQLHIAPRPAHTSAAASSLQSVNGSLSVPRFRVGVYTIGLGVSYFQLALMLVESGQRHFCQDRPDVLVDYFVFTNRDWADADVDTVVDTSSVQLVRQAKRGWPFDSDLRYEFIDNHTNEMSAEFASTPIPFTHYVWVDADNHFAAPVCSELLGALVATQHPHFLAYETRAWPYESSQKSRAYVPQSMQRLAPYYTAHLFAATAERFKHLVKTLAENTRIDRAANVQAVYDDESHLNAYLVNEHIPSAVLSRAYVWPEGKDDMDADAKHMLDLERLGGMRFLSAKSKLKRRKED